MSQEIVDVKKLRRSTQLLLIITALFMTLLAAATASARDFPDYKFFVIPAKDVRDKDAVEARLAVTGLLENARVLREEYRNPMELIFESIRMAFAGKVA